MGSSVRNPSAFTAPIKQAYFIVEFWLSFLKVFTIFLFIIVGIFVNVGLNTEHRFIGVSNWQIPGAPFVGGFGGFARVFVTASYACMSFFGGVRRYIFTFRLVGGTESLGITAGETKNPSKNMPRVVKLVFWR